MSGVSGYWKRIRRAGPPRDVVFRDQLRRRQVDDVHEAHVRSARRLHVPGQRRHLVERAGLRRVADRRSAYRGSVPRACPSVRPPAGLWPRSTRDRPHRAALGPTSTSFGRRAPVPSRRPRGSVDWKVAILECLTDNGDAVGSGSRARVVQTDLLRQELRCLVVAVPEHLGDDLIDRLRVELGDLSGVLRCCARLRRTGDDHTTRLKELRELVRRFLSGVGRGGFARCAHVKLGGNCVRPSFTIRAPSGPTSRGVMSSLIHCGTARIRS